MNNDAIKITLLTTCLFLAEALDRSVYVSFFCEMDIGYWIESTDSNSLCILKMLPKTFHWYALFSNYYVFERDMNDPIFVKLLLAAWKKQL